MNGFRAFLKRKNIEFSAKRYGVDALGAMAQGLFCTLLVGTILNTLGTQFHIGFLSATVVTVGTGDGPPLPFDRGGASAPPALPRRGGLSAGLCRSGQTGPAVYPRAAKQGLTNQI